ncbi:flagellar biosynthesis regulatory protein FlaF [Devosia pacifica]|uniref:Flagellar biosynthesis regulatory protein FlaF n=1 Tax=Devosia pacifica TaxID=1335967 RepID=A0A918VNA6_9HYPH|nr:flagellar biosynthesis regulator FlaF [Devosia pacifica]GHA14787.1 flagellar biosynthesis regulatory protein FlaF [Devosia pacifica]
MYQQGAQAYQETAKTVESPRDREAALLVKAALGLQRLKDNWQDLSHADMRSALTFNRKLWTILMSSVVKEDNPLPQTIKQNVANLGIYMLNQTREIMLEPTADKLDPMININRQLAAGLRGSAG